MKYFVTSMVLLSASFYASAIPTEQALELCRAEQNALKRLVCYDAINVNSVTASKQAISSNSEVNTKPIESNTEKNFGLEHSKQQDADLIYVTVKNFNYTAHDKLQIEFENGQKWRQQGSDYYPIAVGERHHIKRGIFNSFMLGSDKNNRTIKIRREQ
ncbi:hypothetical protein [Rheinheimera sp. WS51]|uniref:hypothetical protein n=1 Tax=Rheinheimera sp. WS51 TaxID=3425886 RepID=UPI003D8D4E9E